MARAIVAAGLHPTIGLHHHNIYNAYRLVDDLMEPFRPIVDIIVYRFVKERICDLTPEIKREFLSMMYVGEKTQQVNAFLGFMQKTAHSLVWVCLDEQEQLSLPELIEPQDVAVFLSPYFLQ